MRLNVNGTFYDFDDREITAGDARFVKKKAEMGLREVDLGAQLGDADALVALAYLAKRQAGEALRWEDLDDLKLVPLMESLREALAAAKEQEGGAGADPTQPSSPTPGTTPNGTSSAT